MLLSFLTAELLPTTYQQNKWAFIVHIGKHKEHSKTFEKNRKRKNFVTFYNRLYVDVVFFCIRGYPASEFLLSSNNIHDIKVITAHHIWIP
jgi:hypothetical protein